MVELNYIFSLIENWTYRMRINWRLEFVWTQRFQKDTGTAHSRDAQIILSGDAGIAATLDQSTTGWRRRFATTSSSVDSVRFGRTFSTAAGSTWFGWQIEIRFWRRCIRKTRSHREQEVIREVFIQLHPVDGWWKSFFVCLLLLFGGKKSAESGPTKRMKRHRRTQRRNFIG